MIGMNKKSKALNAIVMKVVFTITSVFLLISETLAQPLPPGAGGAPGGGHGAPGNPSGGAAPLEGGFAILLALAVIYLLNRYYTMKYKSEHKDITEKSEF